MYLSGIIQAQGYLPHVVVWPMKTLDSDYLAPKQFAKVPKGLDDFLCACVCVEFRFHLFRLYCLRLRLCLLR